ncbi:MAG: hypothetical protein EBV03_01805 [Proteobacteria bacterium]|nr:hypothetical protein [Pseudomonadota bacterium]
MFNARMLTLLLLPLALASCTDQDTGYANPGDPERQLVVTSDLLTIELEDASSITELKNALKIDPPSRATLNCPADGTLCKQARFALAKAHIPFGASGNGTDVTLTYERVVGMDCDQRYRNNHRNNANQNHAAFGCSLRANTVQMVSDKQQFVNPGLLDYMDGEKAAQTYGKYLNPPEETADQTQGGNAGSLIGASQ